MKFIINLDDSYPCPCSKLGYLRFICAIEYSTERECNGAIRNRPKWCKLVLVEDMEHRNEHSNI